MASLMAGSTLNTLAERELQGARLGPTGQATAQKANSCDRLRTVYSNSQAAKGKAVSKSAQNNWGKNISSNLQALKCNIATTCRNNLQYPPSLWCTFTSALLLTDDIFAHLIKTVLMIAYYGCATWVESIKFNFLCTTIMSDPVSWAHAVHCFLGLLYPTGSWLTPHIHIPPTLLDWISCFQKPAYIDICIGMLLSGCQLSLFSRKDS